MTPETSILDAALRVRSELPFSCKGGMCATCKGRIEEGEVRMDKNYALVDSEPEAGYVLTCQSHRSRIGSSSVTTTADGHHPQQPLRRGGRCREAVRRAWLSRHIHARPGTRAGAARFVALRPCRVEAGPPGRGGGGGARLFQDSAEEALARGGTAAERLRRLVAGHVAVARNSDVVRTFLNEARMLDEVHPPV